MDTVKLKIDGLDIEVPKDYTILEAAKELKIDIPTLCYLKGINEVGSCRVCIVEVEGWRGLHPACVTKVSDGMVVSTSNSNVREARKNIVELIMANHNRECLSCKRNMKCELQKLCNETGISEVAYEKKAHREPMDVCGSVVRDPSKCVLCGRCVGVCSNTQNVGAINFAHRGPETSVSTPYGESLAQHECINCGQCIKVCPVGALQERDDTDIVWKALENREFHVVVQTAPSIRVALGEEFGLPPGTNVEGKMVSALKRLGFAKVFDTSFSADLTIVEEGNELIDRIENGGKLPVITSCSPGWIKFCEHNYPDFLENLSTCKSPQQMFGAIAKSYYAKAVNIDPKKVYVVSVMPCTAKKFEAAREEMAVHGNRDVDIVITTRELAKMIRQARIDFVGLPEGEYDSILGTSSGAGVIFGNTGGVMEAALRTVADKLTGQELKNIDYTGVRGLEGIREAEIKIGDMNLRLAVANGTGNAAKLMDKIRAGEEKYDFIEVMGCEGGCINGGGQPIIMDKSKSEEVKKKRIAGLYAIDKSSEKRKSHENPEIKKLYENYLESPGSHIAHELLHTHFVKRDKYL